MKQGTRPTLKQKLAIKAAGWNFDNWLVERDTNKQLRIVHRYSGTVKNIDKA